MLPADRNFWFRNLGLCIAVVAIGASLLLTGFSSGAATSEPAVTNLPQAELVAFQNSGRAVPIILSGQVCWLDTSQQSFAVLDQANGLVLKMNLGEPTLRVGQIVQITGSSVLTRAPNAVDLGADGVVVNNDGLHPAIEKSNDGDFTTGDVAISVEWFNQIGPAVLELSWEGPDFPRRPITEADLFRKTHSGAETNGIEYNCYEGMWTELPDFDRLNPVRTGTSSEVTVDIRTRAEGAGLRFNGLLRIPRNGHYRFFLNSDDGARLSVGNSNLKIEVVDEKPLPKPRRISPRQVLDEQSQNFWSEVEGKITDVQNKDKCLALQLGSGAAQMEILLADSNLSPSALTNRFVRATGLCLSARNPDGSRSPDQMLVPNEQFLKFLAPPAAETNTNETSGLPLLSTAKEVHQLKRDEAQRAYPAKVRGVVTSIDPGPPGFTLQDASGGVYVQRISATRIGEFVEVEGVTDPGSFAPMILANAVHALGNGRMPEPIHPAWEQLMNGSLDAQYVEIEGIVTSVSASGQMLDVLTHGGTLRVELYNYENRADNPRLENTLVRIRGVLIALRNEVTHQVKLGELRIFNPTVFATPPPQDIFSAPRKTPAELLLFDPQASLFQRVQMSGQIVYLTKEMGFMLSGNSGVRFVAGEGESVQVGDTVDVVGYPQQGGASPLLHQAVLRKTGSAPLPEPIVLNSGKLANADYDATRVRVQATLAALRETGSETVLEMQDGTQNFIARLRRPEILRQPLSVGSRLELTGVYVVQGTTLAPDRHIASFELWLNSARDLKILARPPWWTLRRLLAAIGALAAVLVFALLWITQLHRKVEERTAALEEQIQKRKNIEQHRAMEQERARVAQDLHDELGSGLTEISMLAALPEIGLESKTHLPQIADRSRQMVTALDEIVWAMNPKHDSLESVGSYLCLYADRFLKPANITFQLGGKLDLPERSLNPNHRHELFLAFKEALTNVVRHSGATEVRLSIRLVGARLRLCISDNGRGLSTASANPEMDGIANMRNRIQKIGGRFCIASQRERGTTLRFYVPLD